MKKVIVFFADGFEECEGLIVVDILRRAGIEVTTASVNGTLTVVSSHGIKLFADTLAENADFESADMIVLPGGMPGTKNLAESDLVRRQCLIFAERKMAAAICAAPSVLADLGILKGKNATCFPGFEAHLINGGASVSAAGVVSDGNIITGQALGSAIPFALELVEKLTDQKTADRISTSIHYGGKVPC